ncbi:MAG: helical backbone metal receptor [Acidobacteriota bacterium]
MERSLHRRLTLIVLGTVLLLGAGAAPAARPERIITMAPNLTEIVFSLGAGERLVAVSKYSDYPHAARALPRAGGFINPDIERVLAYQPDLVILRDYSTRLEEKLRAFSIPVLRVHDESISDIMETIRSIGEALGTEPEAARLTASIERDLEQFRRRPEPARRPRVLLVTGRSPGTLQNLYTTGRGTFLHEMIRLAGGENLFGDSRIPYPKLSKEEIIARDPEVIVEPVSATSYNGARPDLGVWQRLGSLSAVRSGRLHLLEGDYVLIPGPRIGQALRDLDRVIRAYDKEPPSFGQTE